MIRDFGTVEAGWWAANVDPSLNSTKVLARVVDVAPDHPAIGKLRTMARGFEHAREHGAEQAYLCYRCRDSCFVFGNIRTDRGHEVAGVSRCSGPAGTCLADRDRLERAAGRGGRARTTEYE